MAKSTFLAGYRPNFETLQQASDNGDLALLECQDKKTLQKVAVIVAVYLDNEGLYNIVPLAKMFDGDPYKELNPPAPGGGFFNE